MHCRCKQRSRMRPLASFAVALTFLILASTRGIGQEFKVLYSFCPSPFNCTDGGAPQASLIQDTAGNLYGTTTQGGKYNQGTAFKLDSAGNYTVLYNFCSASNCTDGGPPSSGLI